MSFLKRLFGGGGGAGADTGPKADPVEYKGFLITPDPISADGQYRISTHIEAEIDGETKTHHLIRADVMRERDDAVEASLRKARQMIDEQGARLFG